MSRDFKRLAIQAQRRAAELVLELDLCHRDGQTEHRLERLDDVNSDLQEALLPMLDAGAPKVETDEEHEGRLDGEDARLHGEGIPEE